MARNDWQFVTGSTNNNSAFFTGIRWRYRDDLFGTSGYPSDRISSNTDIIEYQPYVGKKSTAYYSNYYSDWLTSYYKYSYNTTSGSDPASASNQLNVSTTFRFDKASTNTNYYLTKGELGSGNPMNTSSNTTSRIIQVPHCSDGTSKLRLYFYFAGKTPTTSFGYAETNQVVTLETIPRASSITVNDANIGSATNIVINKASSSFTTTLYYKASGQGSFTKIVDKTSNQVYGWIVPTSFYSLIPNAKTIQCQFYAETYSGSTLVGTSATVTATFTATGNPIINSVSATDINSVTANLTEGTSTSSKMVKYASNVQIVVSATRQNGSYISAITVNGQQATLSGSSSDATRTGTIQINEATTNSFVIVVIDSRGYTTSQTKTMTMIDYVPLTINPTIKRHTPTDGQINININGNYFNGSFGNQNNILNVQYRYKESGHSSWDQDWTNGSVNPTISGNAYSYSKTLTNMDYTKTFVFEIRATDAVETKTVTGITVTKGEPIFWWNNYGLHVPNYTETDIKATSKNDMSSITNTNAQGIVKFLYNVSNGTANLFDHTDNANAIIQISKHGGNYDSQLGFSSNGNIYYKSCDSENLADKSWKRMAFTNDIPTVPTKVSQLQNDSGFTTFDCNIGTSGIWSYAKFSNGLAICYAREEKTISVSNSFGDIKTSASQTVNDFPFNFTAVPTVSRWIDGSNSGIPMNSGNVNASVSNAGGYQVARGTTVTNGSFIINTIAIGKWK